MDLKVVEYESVDWIHLAHYGVVGSSEYGNEPLGSKRDELYRLAQVYHLALLCTGFV
jgi:hypothetical protein